MKSTFYMHEAHSLCHLGAYSGASAGARSEQGNKVWEPLARCLQGRRRREATSVKARRRMIAVVRHRQPRTATAWRHACRTCCQRDLTLNAPDVERVDLVVMLVRDRGE